MQGQGGPLEGILNEGGDLCFLLCPSLVCQGLVMVYVRKTHGWPGLLWLKNID